jgi:hypothetical protein
MNLEDPFPPFEFCLYVAKYIPSTMFTYFNLWSDYYDTDEIIIEYDKGNFKHEQISWDTFLDHLRVLRNHHLLEYKHINGTICVNLREFLVEIKNPSQQL